MGGYKSPLDIIAEMTAKTVTEVSNAYHDKYPNGKGKQPKQQTQGYPFGTSFEDIVKFTDDVQVLAKHIDARFRHTSKEKSTVKKEDGKK